MKISGFTFLRNAVVNGYPFVESIRSLLPIVDEYIVAVGAGLDDTRKKIEDINDPKIRIIDTQWNEAMRDRGFVYGQQKMIAQYNCTGDWAFYLEGDEVLHEAELQLIRQAMIDNLDKLEVDALYFDFLHFYGTPDQIGVAGYRQAPRIVRNSIRTIAPDGLFWVVMDENKRGRYPTAKYAGGKIYHYGHCRNVSKMNSKLKQIGKYWGSDHHDFRGYGSIDVAELREFKGSHPAVMRNWLEQEAELSFAQDQEYELSRRDIRNRVRFWIEDRFGLEISKKHFSSLE